MLFVKDDSRPMAFLKSKSILWLIVVANTLLALCIFMGIQLFQPSIVRVECLHEKSGQWELVKHPFEVCNNDTDTLAKVFIQKPRILWSSSIIQSQGTLQSIEGKQFSGYQNKLQLTPSDFKTSSIVEVTYTLTSHRLFLTTKIHSSILIGALILFLLTNSLLIFSIFRFKKENITVPVLICIGVGLRLFYTLQTSIDQREHDMYGHLDYINFIIQNWAFPSVNLGWQTYHPPLYYSFLATAHWFQGLFFAIDSQDLQLWSLLSSLATFFIAILISYELFSKKETIQRYVFITGIACLPGLIFFAPRINNDVFAQVSLFLSLYFIIRWWKTHSDNYWLWAIIASGLGCLAKSNAAITVFIAFAALFFQHQKTWKSKLHLMMYGIFVLVSLLGWFHFQRFIDEDQNYIVGNITAESLKRSELDVSYDPTDLFVLNPIKMVSIPYAEPRGELRSRFIEYVFKSTFFGQYVIERHSSCQTCAKWTSKSIIVLGLVSLLFMFIGLYWAMKNKPYDLLPMWMTLVITGALLLYMRLSPLAASTTQDFRYISIISVPILYFSIKGALWNTTWSRVTSALLWLLFILCSISIINITI